MNNSIHDASIKDKYLERVLKNSNKNFKFNLTELKNFLTATHFENILKQPIKELRMCSTYNNIQNWKFIRNMEIPVNVPFLKELNRLWIYGQPDIANKSCLGELFIGFHFLNNNLNLREMRIENYTFKKYAVPENVNIKTESFFFWKIVKSLKMDM